MILPGVTWKYQTKHLWGSDQGHGDTAGERRTEFKIVKDEMSGDDKGASSEFQK